MAEIVLPEIETLPADDPNKPRLGWRVYEEVGIMILNDYAISNIILTPPIEDIFPEIIDIDIDMSHLFDDIENRFGLMEI